MSHSNHFVLAALIGLAAVSVSCSDDISVSEKSKVSLNVQAFGIESIAFSRASESQPPHRIVFKAFDSNGDVAYQDIQASGDEGFGSLDFELSPGEYTFVAVAHDVSNAVTDPATAAAIVSKEQATMPEALVQDAFSKTMNVTVKPGEAFSANMTLPRIVSRLEIIMNDAIPLGTKTMKITANTAGTTLSGNASFNPSTGLALSNWQYVKETDISSAINVKGAGMGLQLFLPADEQTINVTATAYDADGKEIISHTLTDVPMKRNRKTVAKGNFFTAGGASTFSFSTAWEAEHQMNY